MAFWSILFEREEQGREGSVAPECLEDLNLDQVIEAITAGKEEYGLRPLFYAPLQDREEIAYRQEVMRALEDKALLAGIGRFAQAMHTRREYMALAERLGNRYQRARWFLEAAEIYCKAVAELDATLAGAELRARGLLGLFLELLRRRQQVSAQHGGRFTAAAFREMFAAIVVTHLYVFARGLYEQGLHSALFLRAERRAGGGRTFKIQIGEPLETSFGEDLYGRIFGAT